jgi:four helix bundle protein
MKPLVNGNDNNTQPIKEAMAAISRLEDITAWREARKLTKQIYNLTGRDVFARDFGLRDQIQRASVSFMSNIAEGFDCESKTEFGRLLGVARRSNVEVQSLRYVAPDVGYVDTTQFDAGYEQARKTKALIGGFKNNLTRGSTRHRTPRT